mmetsp:Transcript_22018/g.28510  ORF Transcript_22018/g.28510 Transcript_22018/m.28510 type:complete len:128 (+) Transcript_22018:820-1203(+)
MLVLVTGMHAQMDILTSLLTVVVQWRFQIAQIVMRLLEARDTDLKKETHLCTLMGPLLGLFDHHWFFMIIVLSSSCCHTVFAQIVISSLLKDVAIIHLYYLFCYLGNSHIYQRYCTFFDSYNSNAFL